MNYDNNNQDEFINQISFLEAHSIIHIFSRPAKPSIIYRKFIFLKPYYKCKNNKISCSICFEQVKKKEYIRELQCNHKFHKKCIDKWVKRKFTCPLCRFDIPWAWNVN